MVTETRDPTAFPINFDPTVQRMRGVAVHGNKPFDVPFISEVADNLWVGGCETGLRLPPHIKHVVSLYRWEQYELHDEVSSVLTVTMYDSLKGPDPGQVHSIASWVNSCRVTGPTLVHCQAGLNRSNLVAATALVQSGWSPLSALTRLQDRRSPAVLCNPVFREFVMGLEEPF